MSKAYTPDELAKSGTENAHQTALFCQCNLHLDRYPELVWYHAIPNGGSRGGSVHQAMLVGAKLKASGVKAGVVDTFLPVRRGRWSGLYLELKKPGKIKQVSKEQKEFMSFVEKEGYAVAVFDNWIDAWNCLVQYLEWKD